MLGPSRFFAVPATRDVRPATSQCGVIDCLTACRSAIRIGSIGPAPSARNGLASPSAAPSFVSGEAAGLAAGNGRSASTFVTKRWPSEIRSISTAIVSTACSSRSRRALTRSSMTGPVSRLPRQMRRAKAIDIGRTKHIARTNDMPMTMSGSGPLRLLLKFGGTTGYPCWAALLASN